VVQASRLQKLSRRDACTTNKADKANRTMYQLLPA
jgi:hypothetical protein